MKDKFLKLTPKQQKLLKFLKDYSLASDQPPSLREIASYLNVKHLSTAHFHLKALEKKGLLKFSRSKLEFNGEPKLRLNFYGYISAGQPFQPSQEQSYIDIPRWILGDLHPDQVYVVRARGNSMVNENILDGDYLIVKACAEAKDGETVIAILDGEATVKKFYRYKDKIVLKPANPAYESIILCDDRARSLEIQGVVIGLYRRYNFG